jgi:hypothetical protein
LESSATRSVDVAIIYSRPTRPAAGRTRSRPPIMELRKRHEPTFVRLL